MKILKFMQSLPAGMLNVPMLATAIVHTSWPQALNVGGATTALFSTGTTTIIGMMLVLTGAQFRLGDVWPTLRRGGVLMLAKLAIGAAAAAAAQAWIGPGGWLGIPAIALVAAMTSTNPGIYLAICNRQGDRVDRAGFGLLNLISVPSIAILMMSSAAGHGIDLMVLVAVLVPFVLGMLVGNLDEELRQFLRPGSALVLPFLGFCFGSMIDLRLVVTAGLSGLLLTLLFVAVNILVLVPIDRWLLRRPGHAALGVGCAAGISTSVPALYAAIDPAFRATVPVATAQIAMVVLITSFLMPWLAGRFLSPAPGDSPAPPA